MLVDIRKLGNLVDKLQFNFNLFIPYIFILFMCLFIFIMLILFFLAVF